MDKKVGYAFYQMHNHHNKLLKKREDIVSNLGMPIIRSGNVINSLVNDLQDITKQIENFESKVVWTEEL